MRTKTELNSIQIEELRDRRAEGEHVNKLAREFKIRTSRVIEYCGGRRVPEKPLYNKSKTKALRLKRKKQLQL